MSHSARNLMAWVLLAPTLIVGFAGSGLHAVMEGLSDLTGVRAPAVAGDGHTCGCHGCLAFSRAGARLTSEVSHPDGGGNAASPEANSSRFQDSDFCPICELVWQFSLAVASATPPPTTLCTADHPGHEPTPLFWSQPQRLWNPRGPPRA